MEVRAEGQPGATGGNAISPRCTAHLVKFDKIHDTMKRNESFSLYLMRSLEGHCVQVVQRSRVNLETPS